jgi:hypothetical protein
VGEGTKSIRPRQSFKPIQIRQENRQWTRRCCTWLQSLDSPKFGHPCLWSLSTIQTGLWNQIWYLHSTAGWPRSRQLRHFLLLGLANGQLLREAAKREETVACAWMLVVGELSSSPPVWSSDWLPIPSWINTFFMSGSRTWMSLFCQRRGFLTWWSSASPLCLLER